MEQINNKMKFDPKCICRLINFEEICNYVRFQYDIIENFGRYPERNGLLRRETTPEEAKWLKSKESKFDFR